MKKYFIILIIAMLPTLVLAQQAGGHITRPTKPATTTTPPKKQNPSKPPKKQTTTKPAKKQSSSNSAAQPSKPNKASQTRTQTTTQPSRPTVSSYSDSNGNKVFNIGNVQFTMVKVDGGTFTMGATSEQGSDFDSYEMPTHSVTLSSYYIGQTEVTQALWQAVMGSNPSSFKGSNKPVEQVSWDDCQTFLRKLNSLTGQNFKLPTEAQWEYAARGGNRSRGYKYSGSNTLASVAWFADNSGNATHDVATKQPNELGLYDMSGNVWEWCADWKGDYSSASQTDPTGPATGSYRVHRGGSWYSHAGNCRVSIRRSNTPGHRGTNLGLRLAL